MFASFVVSKIAVLKWKAKVVPEFPEWIDLRIFLIEGRPEVLQVYE